MRKLWTWWERFWFGPAYAPQVLALLRIALGAILLSHLLGWGPESPFWRGPATDYLGVGFYSSYQPWLLPPPHTVFVRLGWLSVLCALSGVLGLFTRWSLLGAVGIAAYQFALNRFFYTNNLYVLLLGVFLCSFMPCGAAWSVDAWWAKRRGVPPPAMVISWAARLLQVLVCLLYVGSATSKLTPDWLSGALVQTFYESGKMTLPPWMGVMGAFPYVWQARATLVMEYGLAAGLWVRRWRPLVLLVGLGFHAFMDLTMSISAFSWQMAAFYLVFLERKRPVA